MPATQRSEVTRHATPDFPLLRFSVRHYSIFALHIFRLAKYRVLPFPIYTKFPSFHLRKAISKQPAVVIFYRGGWCPYCNLELGRLQEAEPELRELGYQILAISPDRPAKLAESAETEDLNYTLLSDATMTAAKAFGIAFRVDDATVERYKGFGIDLAASSGQAHQLLPVPAVFLIGADGKIGFAYANPDYRVRMDPSLLLCAAKAALPDAQAGEAGE